MEDKPKTRTAKLRVSDSVKRKDDFAHTKALMNHYINSGSYYYQNTQGTARDVRLFYEAYNNRLPDSYFNYVTNPLNSSNKDFTNWPAKLRPYSIIRPNVDLLEGEYERRPFAFTVKVHNTDAVNLRQEQLYKDILFSLEQTFINSLNEKQQDTGLPTQETQPPEKIQAAYESNYRDKRAEVGETALNIILDQQHLEEKLKKLFRDWLIAGECYTYKGIRGGRMVYERVSPLDIDYDKSPDCDYVEDGQWVVRRIFMTPSEVVDNFYEEMEAADFDLIEDQNGNLAFRPTSTATGAYRDDRDLKRAKIVVYHVVWKYMTKIGILSYTNELTGELEEIEVPETFKPDKEKGESVEWFWVNEVWEGYRIEDDLYLGIQPLPGQRNTVNNLSLCKLPYNGKRFSDTHSQNISIVEMGLAYETLHRILHFQMEKTIAKSKGKIVIMDQNSIPKKHGWDEEKFLYWADATGWAMIDRNQPGADKSFNQYAVLDMGLYQHLDNLIGLMDFVKSEWDDLLGITRQRKGQVNSSDTVRGTQTAVNQSTVISEKIFSTFEEFTRNELQGLLDLSKIAWLDGFNQVYQGDDLRTKVLEIDPNNYTEMDMGVHISRSARDLQNLEMVRQQVQAFSQNGASPSTIVDVVQARSLSKLKSVLQEAEQRSMEAQQSMNAAETEAAERLELIKGSFEELKGVIDEKLINVEYDRKEDIEHIKGSYSTFRNVEGDGDNNDNGVPDAMEVQKLFAERDKVSRKERFDYTKLRSEEKRKEKELALKNKELEVRERIADKANKTALKNKVVGEKSKKK